MRVFPALVSPNRSELVTSMSLTWRFSHEDVQPQESAQAKQDYDEIWDVIVSFPNLRRLFVAITMAHGRVVTIRNEEPWLDQLDAKLGRLKYLRDCVVWVTTGHYLSRAAKDERPNSRFTLIAYKDPTEIN